jgi:hypothetical protein
MLTSLPMVRAALFIGAMQHRTVLDVHTIADTNGVHITPHHRIVPYAALRTRNNITDHNGSFGEECIGSESGCEAVDRADEGHGVVGS